VARRTWYVVGVNYPSVYRAHIVPKGYLRGFAINDRVAVRKGGLSADVEVKSVDKAAWRKRSYERTRPKTGENQRR
jgi:hypothetical protein